MMMNNIFATMNFTLILLLIFVNNVISNVLPTNRIDGVQALAAELDKNEIVHEMSIKFSGELQQDKVVHSGSSFELRCEAAGSPPPLFHWTLDGKKIQGSSVSNIYEKLQNVGKPTIQNAVTISRIVVPCAGAEDAGLYKCIASNGHEKVERDIVVKVEASSVGESCEGREPEGPKIVQWSDARFENENNVAQLTCRSNDPKAKFAWYDEERKLLNTDPEFEVLLNGDLVIKSGKWEQMGSYTCVASNDYGEDRVDVFFYPTAAE